MPDGLRFNFDPAVLCSVPGSHALSLSELSHVSVQNRVLLFICARPDADKGERSLPLVLLDSTTAFDLIGHAI